MMSPDPPREERLSESEDSTRIPPDPITIEGAWVDMGDTDEILFAPEGPHEMDMGGSESEYSSDEDQESPTFRDSTDESQGQRTQEDGQVRGYYQLLIPFPAPEQSGSSDDPEGLVYSFGGGGSSVGSTEESRTVPTDDGQEMTEGDIEKREIELTPDNVETIKSVMKGFVLPQASIPGWAGEIDEEVWKMRLFDTFDTKKSQEPS